MNTQRGLRMYEQLNSDSESVTVLEKKKGRSSSLIALRNEQLFYRYYYYAKLLRLKYNDVISQLQNEFCLSPTRIVEIIMENGDKLTAIYNDNPDTRGLAKLFPHFNWSIIIIHKQSKNKN